MPFGMTCKPLALASYTHAEYLSGIVPKPFIGLGGSRIKPRVRVKMGKHRMLSEFEQDYVE